MTTEIFLDVARETTPIVIFAKQNDGDRSISATLLKDGLPYNPTGSLTAEFKIKRADGTGCSGNATITSGSKYTVVSFSIPTAALSVAGIAQAEIKIRTSRNYLTTESFFLNVRESAGTVT